MRRMTAREVISVLSEHWLQFLASQASIIQTRASLRVQTASIVQRDTTVIERVLRTI